MRNYALPILVVLLGLVSGWVGLKVHGRYARPDTPAVEVAVNAPLIERVEAVEVWAEELNAEGLFNGGVMVRKGGKTMLMKTWGIVDPRTEEPLTTHTRFRLASVTKHITGVAMLALVAEGRVDLADRVDQYLPGFPYPDVRVVDLLQHTSGIAHSYVSLAPAAEARFGPVLSIAEVVQLVNEAPPNQHAPAGTVNAYSNTDSVLAAAVIEAVSGQSFEAYLDALFSPLEMKARVYNLSSAKAWGPDMAMGYSWHTREVIEPRWIDGVAGDGGVFASLEDLAKWDAFLDVGSDRVPLALLERSFAPGTLRNGDPSPYGMGWVIEPRGVSHRGSWLGAHTFYGRFGDLTLVVLDNSRNSRVREITEQIRAVLLP